MKKVTREKVWSWYNIAQELDVHEATAKRWCREEASFRGIIRRWRRRIFVYRDDLENWKDTMERRIGE